EFRRVLFRSPRAAHPAAVNGAALARSRQRWGGHAYPSLRSIVVAETGVRSRSATSSVTQGLTRVHTNVAARPLARVCAGRLGNELGGTSGFVVLHHPWL